MKQKNTKHTNQSKVSAIANSASQSIKRRFEQSPIHYTIALFIALGIIANIIGITMAWQKHVVEERRIQMEAFTEHNARIAASNVSNYIHDIHERLDFFSKSNSLRKALINNDNIGILESRNTLKNSFPRAKNIRIFRIDEAKVDLDASTPLHFSELDIIQKAQKRETMIPEALNLGQGWQINVVAPVPKDPLKPVAGTILITLPIEALYNSLTQGLDNLGRIGLYQTFGGKPRLIGSFGEGSLYKAHHIDIPNTPWRVEFTASETLFSQTKIDFALLIMIAVIAMCLSLGLCAFLGATIGRRIIRKQLSIAKTHEKMGRTTNPEYTESDNNILDVEISLEDEDLLGIDESASSDLPAAEPVAASPESNAIDEAKVPSHIFRSYDIRGLAETEISNDFALWAGKSLGSEALDQGESALIVARDARLHSPILMENLIRGIMDTGCNVINIGTVPTPLMYFATETLSETSSGVMVTASHNPGEYNGFKVIMNGKTRTAKEITSMRAKMIKQDFRHGIGQEQKHEIVSPYIETIFSDVALASDIRIVIDAGNGVAGKVAPALFEELGCEVISLYCDLDGNFPNHNPDPSDPANLQDLISKVQTEEADLGVAFDGDGDRLAVVTSQGKIIWPDQLLMLFSKDILARNPGADVVFDVKSSRLLNSVINSHGGRPIMWKTGHAPMRSKVAETGALLGGEYSGHIFIKDRWYGFDDGMYTAARLVEIMSLRDETLDEIFDEFPSQCITPEYRIPVADDKKMALVQKLIAQGDFADAKIISLDGLRAEYPYGWGLVRASNTGAEITLRFEAETEDHIHNLKAMFTREIRKIDNTIEFNW